MSLHRPKRQRKLPPLSLESIRRANPSLDDDQCSRAYLKPVSGIDSLLLPGHWSAAVPALQMLDKIVDALCGDAEARHYWQRTSRTRVSPRDLQLFTVDTSAEMLAAALHAGFFPFASEFAFPGRPLAARGLLNLELGGPEIDRVHDDPGGRLVLDLSPAADRLTLGKRSMKKVRAVVGGGEDDDDDAGESAGTPYRLTVCAAFERVWEQIVAQHGVDWCGFEAVRAAFHALHAHAPAPWAASSASDEGMAGCPPRVISIELWDTSRADELVSAEVGVLVGRAYTCLSLFARTSEYPRCDWVRTQAAVLRLREAGVELFDAGTTASYFSTLYGFRRCASRRLTTRST